MTKLAAVSAANMQGGNHLIIADPKHKRVFDGYARFFNRPRIISSLENQGATVLILSNNSKPTSFAVDVQSSISEARLSNVVGVLPQKKWG